MNLLKKFFQHIDPKLSVRSVACALVLLITLNVCGFSAKCDVIRENVLRLHVLANSDSPEDQALKLKVRDGILKVSEEVFEGCQSVGEAEAVAREHLPLFKSVAERIISDNGYDYAVKVELSDTWFETRDYDGFSLPAGNYEALRVLIGEANGKNWWCVMFPSVCIPAATKGKKDFSKALSDSQSDIVTHPQRYKARFKIVEIFQNIAKSVRG